jgi:hypothetical protein
MIVSIGVDCSVAAFCKQNGMRFTSFPFDWTVAYNGVSKCIENEFADFLNVTPSNRLNKYDIHFFHHFANDAIFEEELAKYKQRVERFLDMLKTTDEFITFCRRGHASHHHAEHDGKYENIKSDIEDAEELDIVLSTKYPQLKYKIIVMVGCGKCFDSSAVYKSNSERIEIYNIAGPSADDPAFKETARQLFIH